MTDVVVGAFIVLAGMVILWWAVERDYDRAMKERDEEYWREWWERTISGR